VTGNSDSPRSRRVTRSERDMLMASNTQPVSQFNPITCKLVLCSANVKDSDIASAVWDKLTDLVKDIDMAPVVSDKLTDLDNAPVGNVVKGTTPVKDKVHSDVVKDKASDVVKHKAPAIGKKKSAGNVVKDTAPVKDKVYSDVVKDKAPDVVKHKAPAVGKKKLAGNVVKDTAPVKDKVQGIGYSLKDGMERA
ncbi:hypothetical protein Tco_1389621, partial [Tanacetum coccineum]